MLIARALCIMTLIHGSSLYWIQITWVKNHVYCCVHLYTRIEVHALTWEIREVLSSHQVRIVIQGSESARPAEELSPGTESAELLHSPLFGTLVLEPHLQKVQNISTWLTPIHRHHSYPLEHTRWSKGFWAYMTETCIYKRQVMLNSLPEWYIHASVMLRWRMHLVYIGFSTHWLFITSQVHTWIVICMNW